MLHHCSSRQCFLLCIGIDTISSTTTTDQMPSKVEMWDFPLVLTPSLNQSVTLIFWGVSWRITKLTNINTRLPLLVIWLHTRLNTDITDTSDTKTVSSRKLASFSTMGAPPYCPTESAHWGHQGHCHAPEKEHQTTPQSLKGARQKPGCHFWCFNSTIGITQTSLAPYCRTEYHGQCSAAAGAAENSK